METGSKDFPQNGFVDYILVKNIFGGTSKIGFKSCDQGREKFQGTSLDSTKNRLKKFIGNAKCALSTEKEKFLEL